jgi:hypothetical protein
MKKRGNGTRWTYEQEDVLESYDEGMIQDKRVRMTQVAGVFGVFVHASFLQMKKIGECSHGVKKDKIW